MDIGVYIAELLKIHEEVSLPGIGTFTRQQKPAFFDAVSGQFNPPSAALSLSDKEGNAATLINFLSERKNLSYSSSEYFVQKFISGLQELLQTSGIAEIQHLGILRKRDQKTEFEASGWSDADVALYGLGPVKERAPVVKETAQLSSDEPDPIERESDFFSEFIKQGDDLTEEGPSLETDEIEQSGRSKFWLVAVGVLGFIILMGFLFYYLSPAARFYADSLFKKQVSSESPLPVTVDSATMVPDSLQAVTEAPDSALVDSSAMKTDSASVQPAPIPDVPITTYEIIGASFGRKADADEYVEARRAKGLPAKIVENMPGNRIKVSIKSFTNQADAQNELNRIIQENKDAWIYTNKPKKK